MVYQSLPIARGAAEARSISDRIGIEQPSAQLQNFGPDRISSTNGPTGSIPVPSCDPSPLRFIDLRDHRVDLSSIEGGAIGRADICFVVCASDWRYQGSDVGVL